MARRPLPLIRPNPFRDPAVADLACHGGVLPFSADSCAGAHRVAPGVGPRRSKAMKQPGHWVVWLTTLLIAASLVALPREGAVAAPIHDIFPPIVDEGDPDVPGTAASTQVMSARHQILGWLVLTRLGPVPLFIVSPRQVHWAPFRSEPPQGHRR